ncbi:MAG: hypothetical protein AAGA91_16440 [Pseudomonadota bacterium]
MATLLVQGCSSTAPQEDELQPVEVPELTLNLPEEHVCDCSAEEAVDYTFLDKGLQSLALGDHLEAVTYFQRYQRMEASPRADWEAGIAMAYDSMLPDSLFYDPVAAQEVFQRLQQERPEGEQFHHSILIMNDALSAFVDMQAKIGDLRSGNAALAEDLRKREEALKRLRELTLGQKGAAP